MARLTGKARKEQIVQTAVQLFAEVGFHGTTTRALAQKAGISEALLFRHFPDKASLYIAILQQKMDERLPKLLADLPLLEGPESVLKTLAFRFVSLHENDEGFLRLLLFSALESHDLSKIFFRKKTLPVVDFLADYFQQCINDGHIKPVAARTTAFAFMAMVFGYLQTRIIFRIPEITKNPVEDWLGRYVDVFLKGILP